MLLAPLSAPYRRAPVRNAHPQAPDDRAARPWLGLWLAFGLLALAAIPPLRGGPLTGATAPYWLIAAPLIDLAWLGWRSRRCRGRGA
jgi:hypothetical protein